MDRQLYEFIAEGKHRAARRDYPEELGKIYAEAGMSPIDRMTDRFERLCAAETPRILQGEQIVFMRSIRNIPDIFTEEEWKEIRARHYIHELGYISNLSPNYEDTIRVGLLARREGAEEHARREIDALIALSDRYLAEAERQGREDIAETLRRVPRYGARNFREALQFFRILHFALWLEGNYHNTVGRFDLYMYPYFKADMDAGVYTEESALALLEDFFLSFNKDSDLYVGVQQGDNGQSMMLGGIDAQGNHVYNTLSRLCLRASDSLRMIDPKINLRVDRNTPIEVYEEGSRLTRAGLGFPQYSNDDVVIPALEKLGYAHEDACNYTVAACWEFIIPKCGFDIDNIAALNIPEAVNRVLHDKLAACPDFETLLGFVKEEIRAECDRITEKIHDLWFVPSPFMGLLLDPIRYRNFGIHGTGIASAADALAAVHRYVFDEKSVTPERLLTALDSDFAEDPDLLHLLRYEAPKMGNDDDYVDSMATVLLDDFADALEGRVNCEGGCYRAGTGTAMYYLWHANEIGATADGRRRHEPYGTNFSANLFAQVAGPVSVIRSFTKQHIERAINGGPLTLEFAASTFDRPESVSKLAMLVKYFIERGGHQLQLNAVDPVVMRDAQEHPEKHRHLVVRIWGWSAYFVELDRDFQDHVIARQEYAV